MSQNLHDKIEFFSNKIIQGEPVTDNGLYWVKGDSGSWDGPSSDWKTHRENILSKVKNFNVCVQAGGNLGLYPLLLSQRFKTVYTFEPDILNFICLTMNVQRDNVFKINSALGSINELVSVHVDTPVNLGMNRVVKNEDNTFNIIPTFMIDQLALKECDLIWLDIEGYEKNAILGALITIENFKPIIVLETVEQYTENVLGSLGYTQVASSIADKVFEYKGK